MRWIGIELSPSFSPGPSAFIFILTLDIPLASVGRPSITGTFISKEKWTISDIQESRDSLPVWLFSTATAGGSSGCVCLCNLSSAPCQPPSSPWGAPESALPNTGLPPRNNGSALFNGGLNPKTFGKGAGIIIEWRCFVDIVSVTTGNTTLKDYWLDNLFSFFIFIILLTGWDVIPLFSWILQVFSFPLRSTSLTGLFL